MLNKKRTPILIISGIIVLSIFASFLAKNVFADIQQLTRNQIKKFLNVVHLVQIYYVEDVSWDKAMEGAISGMLSKLDPHSVYIPPKKAQENKESFSGHYEGIGIQFDIIDGYLTVIAPIAGSPSDKLGIQAGDRIVKINGKSAIGITREEVPKKLKGPKGTTVNVTILREGVDQPLEFTIVRDVIPITTVTTYFMADDSTGYVSINRFAATTSDELERTLRKLEARHMKRLILDLRGNPGGYLHEAVKVAAKFIPGHQLVVFTKGRSGTIEDEYYTDQFGRHLARTYPLIILIDRGSASASEIVAGAIQDYDRGLIIGTNSFGKGLVQKEFTLQDGSAVRITTAKYYTPSGRCIQRDYKGKRIEEYYSELRDSTYFSEDSLKNRPLFYTRGGRPVHGSGGIHPDVRVPYKSGPKSPVLVSKIAQKRLFFEFANGYAKKHPRLKTTLQQFEKTFHVSDALFADFVKFCKSKGIEFDTKSFQKDKDYISMRLKAEMARTFWENDGFYFVLIHHDNQFQAALKLFDKARELLALSK